MPVKTREGSLFTLLVDNEFGVLTRITALIRRAGWNIRSLAVAETATPELSRLTICLECRHNTLDQVLDRLERLDCVREITLFSPREQVAQELALIRMRDGRGVETLCEKYGARPVDRGGGECTLSLTCEPSELDALLPTLSGQGLLEIARSGAIALMRAAPEPVPKQEEFP